jgi:single-strand DNA-binding protein
VNAINLSGHLTKDPKLVYRNNRPVCEMRLAVNNGSYGPTYIDVRTFDEQAYVCAEYVRKGSKVAVSGRLVYDEWRAPDGARRSRYSVVGWVEFLDHKTNRREIEVEDPDLEEFEDEDLEEDLELQLSLVA